MPREFPFVCTGRKLRWLTHVTTVENGHLFSDDPCPERDIGSAFGVSSMPIRRANGVALVKRLTSFNQSSRYSNEICTNRNDDRSNRRRRCVPAKEVILFVFLLGAEVLGQVIDDDLLFCGLDPGTAVFFDHVGHDPGPIVAAEALRFDEVDGMAGTAIGGVHLLGRHVGSKGLRRDGGFDGDGF